MRLQSLEIKGFKSFGDRVIIHFDKGTTSIVGPNGSGKSNVVDAIRWVLGEQKTRMLRSEKMENIIFNGTKTRKPANLAEVTLNFENTKNILPVEYTHISISRKLYRSGDSEYYLNGVQCRLKDITDLFMDTGIGPDSYSIIELKMVDEILNDKNSTIKMLLEEAAGISKYKIRKRQTLQKLEETETDLNRVNDLLFEIEKSMKQLEAQAKRTARYYRLKDEYKELMLGLSVYSSRQARESLAAIEKKETLLKDDKIEISVKQTTLEASLEKLKVANLDKEKALSSSQKQLNDLLIRISKTESELKALQERLAYLSEKEKQLTNQNEKDGVTSTELTEAVENLTSEKMGEQAKFDLIQLELEELKAGREEVKASCDRLQSEISVLNRDIAHGRQELNEMETRRAVQTTRAASLSEELVRVRQQKAEQSERMEQSGKELEMLKPVSEGLSGKIHQLDREKTEGESRLRHIEEEIIQCREDAAEQKRRLDARINEYELTKNLVEQMDGYPESIKFLKKSNHRFRSAPLVSEIVTCKEAYKTAIENYLEPFLNHFVVDTRGDAWEALHLLKGQNQGRASFFILDRINRMEPAAPVIIAGCIPALEVVEFDEKYRALFGMLLGNAYVAEEESGFESTDLAAYPGGAVLLSKSGHFLKQVYTMSGGSVGLFDGKRTGQSRNLENLASQIKELREEVNRKEMKLKELTDLQDLLKEETGRKQAERIASEQQLMEVWSKITAVESERRIFTDSLEDLARSERRIEEQLQFIHTGSDPEETEAAFIENRRQELERKVQEQQVKQQEADREQQLLEEKTELLNQKQIALLQLQNKIQNLVRDAHFKTTQIETLRNTRQENDKELVLLAGQISEINASLGELNERLIAEHQEKQAFEVTLNRHEEEYYQGKADIDREEKNISELRRQREQTEVIIQSLHDESNELKLQLNSLSERLRIEFNTSLEELAEPPAEMEFNAEESRQRTEKLKIQIEQFGAINPLALESFNEVKERFDFIHKEKQDLHEAKQSLLQTISEIDTTAREKFMEAYDKIRENFVRVFRSLFSEEDTCDLVLLDVANPLESDIQIVAQPKGKKPLSIHQLSGGEKTLTATALLFGIYLLKPSPFCVFDEVDAPLDDANIDKFNKIIRKFSADSQFIIITHNKRTMAATDIMYGITMAEMGVTQVVPVDLKSYAEV